MENGRPTTWAGAVQSIAGALPPAFVMLCLINLIFLYLLMWFLNGQIDARMKLIEQIITACLKPA